MEKIVDDSYKSIVDSEGYVILDFSSPGCAPCKKVPPLIEEIISDLPDKDIKGYEIDVTENPSSAQDYFVLGVPTIIVFKNGKELKRFNSVPGKAKIIKAIK
jgi:thioredoxin 1